MSDDIVIGGGGSSAVATSELFEDAQRLAHLRTLLDGCLRHLAAIDRIVGERQLRAIDAPISAVSAERAVDDAAALIRRAVPSTERLHAALVSSAEEYGWVERTTEQLGQQLAARMAALVGLFSPGIAVGVFASAVFGGIVAAGVYFTLPPNERTLVAQTFARLRQESSSLLSDPFLVQLVRLGVMSADDFGEGALEVPPWIINLLGDEGLGILGLATSSGVVIALARPTGALVETPVMVARDGGVVSTTRAMSFSDRAARVPAAAAQVRVDRYVESGQPDRFEVYIGGTRDLSLEPKSEPWDMTSNLNAIAGDSSAAYRAVQQAMTQAGVAASSPVIFTGYSQGGLVAAQLAASGDYSTRGLYTLGAPAAQVHVATTIPWVAVEHTDDLVPALGGTWATADPVLVRRHLFADVPVDTSVQLPAHQLDAYRQTASLVDASTEHRLVTTLHGFDAFGSGATAVESTLYDATRVGKGAE